MGISVSNQSRLSHTIHYGLLTSMTVHPTPMKPQDNCTTPSLMLYSKPKQKALMKRPPRCKYHDYLAPYQEAPTLQMGLEAQSSPATLRPRVHSHPPPTLNTAMPFHPHQELVHLHYQHNPAQHSSLSVSQSPMSRRPNVAQGAPSQPQKTKPC